MHPKHIGGAIVSIDKMEPESAWLWAGLDWEKCVSKNDNAERLCGVVMQSDDKSALVKMGKSFWG